jgi:hypothetical protein
MIRSSGLGNKLAGIELYRILREEQHIHAKNSTAFGQFYALAA